MEHIGATEDEAACRAARSGGTTLHSDSSSQPPAGGGGATGDIAAGKKVFASGGCGGCHTLADAGSSGAVGPNLDQAKPDAALVKTRVTNGRGVMPSFKGQFDATQIADVAAYVSSVAGK